jgi:RimJ/RimL family protein N-acetyltransferase
MRAQEILAVTEMTQEDVTFLQALWRNRRVMRFADEFPRFRGWSRRHDSDAAWGRYQEKRARLGSKYTQLIVRLSDGTPIGECFFAPLKEGGKIGQLRIPSGTTTVIGDIKLLPEYWGRGLGTLAMREAVRFAFEKAGCDAFVVPPHKKNRAAVRVYEKAGFRRVRRRSPWPGHMLMRLTRDRFLQLYAGRNASPASPRHERAGQPPAGAGTTGSRESSEGVAPRCSARDS